MRGGKYSVLQNAYNNLDMARVDNILDEDFSNRMLKLLPRMLLKTAQKILLRIKPTSIFRIVISRHGHCEGGRDKSENKHHGISFSFSLLYYSVEPAWFSESLLNTANAAKVVMKDFWSTRLVTIFYK